MKFKYILFLIGLFLLADDYCCGQGKLVFLNGKVRHFEKAEVVGDFVVYQPEGQTKPSLRKADRYNVFSIVNDDGTEQIIYDPDTSEGGDPTIAEVRDYIRGEQHAAITYRKPMNLIGGIGSGLAGSTIGFFGIPVPFIYTTIVGSVNPKLPRAELSANHADAYVAGYQRKARNMKIKHSLIGGGIGFSVGIAALAIILADN
jgi:hypothetical protein